MIINKLSIFLIISFPLFYIIGPLTADISISLISLLFLVELIKNKNYEYFKTKIGIILTIIWVYLNLNSLININNDFNSFGRSLTFIRYVLIFFAISHYLKNIKHIKIFFYFQILILLFVGIDLTYQSYFDVNLFGWTAPHSTSGSDLPYIRPTGVFRDEEIAGSFFLKNLYLSLIGLSFFVFSSKKSIFKVFSISLYYIFLIYLVILSGERMQLLLLVGSVFLAIPIFLYFDQNNINKIKIIIFTFSVILIICLLIYFNPSILNRFSFLKNLNQLKDCTPDYICIFQSGIEVWKENIFFGVGLKNYRNVCPELTGLICTTHPHNFYIEIIAELGIVGISLFIILIIFILKDFLKACGNNSLILYFTFAHLFIIFWPISTTGSIFSNYNGILIWTNLGIVFAIIKYINKQLNDQNN
jgi:O-antigen ligase